MWLTNHVWKPGKSTVFQIPKQQGGAALVGDVFGKDCGSPSLSEYQRIFVRLDHMGI